MNADRFNTVDIYVRPGAVAKHQTFSRTPTELNFRSFPVSFADGVVSTGPKYFQMPRKSRAAVEIENNPALSPEIEHDSELEISLPDPPPHLNEVARELWFKLGKTLVRMRLVTEADFMSLAALCADYSLYLECSQILADEGYYCETSTGYKALHPLVTVRNQSIDRVLKISSQYGLSPASRMKLKTGNPAGKEAADPFLDWGN